MLKKILYLAFIICILTQASAAAAGKVITDTCNNFNSVYEYDSENWEVKTNNSDKLGGDTGRFQRKTNDSQYLVYQIKNPAEVSVLFYYNNASFKDLLTISASSDNQSYTSLATTKSAYNACSGTWSGDYVVANSIPRGTKYIKIEIGAMASSRLGTGIGEVKLTEGASEFVNTAIPEPGENVKITDDCSDFTKLFDKSANWVIDSGNSETIGGDTGRFSRSRVADDWLVYNVAGATAMTAILCSAASDPLSHIEIEVSGDNVTYTPVAYENASADGHYTAGWTGIKLTASFPEGTNYIKIHTKQVNVEWQLQWGSFEFESSPYFELKTGDTTVSGGVATASYTVKVSTLVYSKATMLIAAYDELGNMVGLNAKTLDLAVGDNVFENTLTLDSQAKKVKIYFLNTLEGLHRICDTVEKSV